MPRRHVVRLFYPGHGECQVEKRAWPETGGIPPGCRGVVGDGDEGAAHAECPTSHRFNGLRAGAKRQVDERRTEDANKDELRPFHSATILSNQNREESRRRPEAAATMEQNDAVIVTGV